MRSQAIDPIAEEQLRQTVEGLHNCRAIFKKAIRVVETFKGNIVWDGIVAVFNLEDHPVASTCYAWSSPIEGSEKRKIYAVLKLPPVESPEDAVRASIARDYKQKG